MKKLSILSKGFLIGFVTIAIPGLSASTLAILFSIYYKMIDSISSLFKKFKESATFLLFLILGYVIGALLGANIVSPLYERYPFAVVLTVLGFIVGALPRMYRELKPNIKSVSNWLVFLITIISITLFSYFYLQNQEVEIKPTMDGINYLVLALIGFGSSITFLIPGLGYSMILLSLGYYYAFVDLLSFWDSGVILNNLLMLLIFLVSYGFGIFVFSKLFKSITKRLTTKIKFISLAFVVASPFVIVRQSIINNKYFSTEFIDTTQTIIGIMLFFIAMGLVLLVNHLNDPNDTRIRAMKKRHMLRFFATIIFPLPITAYYLWKMNQIIDKNLLTFEERYDFCLKLVKLVNKYGNVHTKVYGRENLSKEATLYIVNHQGRYDGCCLLTALEGYPCTVIGAKDRVIHHFYMEMFEMLEGEFIVKNNMREQVAIMKNIGRRLSEGTSFFAFIEGKYEDNGNNLQYFHTGVLHPAYASKCRIVPVVLYDSYKVYSISSLKRIEPEAHILEAIPYEEYKDITKNELADLLKEKMQAKIDEIKERKNEK